MTTITPAGRPVRSRLPEIDVSGVGTEAGAAYGEACRELIDAHVGDVLERLAASGIGEDEAASRALSFRGPVSQVAPALASEIDGIADGAGIALASAWLLQLRAEVAGLANPECTTFAVGPERSATGRSLVALNADLPAAYRELMVVLRRRSPARPDVLTVTPAGQVGHHGFNELGVTVVANFLHCAGWRLGMPRYLWTRLALEEETAVDAVVRIEGLDRAASRNLLVADDTEIINLETTVDAAVRTGPSEGIVAHTNHYLTELADLDTADAEWLHNSRTRLQRVTELLARYGRISVEDAIEVLRDRRDAPHAICHHADDLDVDVATVCSTVIDVGSRRAWVAPDAPDRAIHEAYALAT